ncbi:hypothetical protein D187_001226 [Cystobacter fuscus DSM 2262]|uniref:Uncharacterized protein n=2 Tax=Cystobacter fuscus TaxID=43 RepID=S9QXP7_CYSF2|nr:hypothetical protein D187_001226 [Cystobacter fuscus DSM 2262]
MGTDHTDASEGGRGWVIVCVLSRAAPERSFRIHSLREVVVPEGARSRTRMMTEMKKSRSLSQVVMAVGAVAFGWMVTGCSGPECVDRFDCQNSKGAPPAGKQYVCEADTCVVKDVASPNPGNGSDAGTDAGTEPEPDAGTDAGTEPEPDAGTEPTACADLPHDARLGTLQLQPGFTVVESAPLPASIGAITSVAGASGSYTVYGVNSDKSVYALGTWPNVAASTTPLFPVVEPNGPQDAFVSNYLASDGVRLVAGYTRADLSGKVAVHDTVTNASTYLSAKGNFSAVGLDGAFLLNGLALEGVSETGSAVYALKTQSTPFSVSRLATFPVAQSASGFNALTTNKIVVLGYYGGNNVLHAVSPETYAPALAAGTSLDLADTNTPRIYAGSDLFYAAGFGAGVALHRGSYSESYEQLTHDVSRIALSPAGSDGKGVTAGDLKAVLTQSNNTCTSVVAMAPLAEDLLVGVEDKNGRRLVRLHAETP